MFELRILNGLKSGVSFQLDADILQVGSAEDSDILMLDNAFANTKLSLFCTKEGLIKLNVLEGNFSDEFAKPVISENEWDLNRYLHIEGVWLKVDKVTTPWPSSLPILKTVEVVIESKSAIKSRKRSDFLFIGGFIACIFGLYNVADAALTKTDEKDFAKSTLIKNINNDTVKTLGAVKKSVDASIAEVVNYEDIVQAMIKERELKDINITVKNGDIHLNGSLTKREKNIITRMIIRYQFENPLGPLIVDTTNNFVESFPVEIVAVVSGLYGNVLLGDGTRLSLGEVYKGYKLVAIRKNKVEFQGKTKVSVNW